MTTIYFVRHGSTEWNDTKRAQGQADIALNDAGRVQASKAAADLSHVELSGVYASDLKRASDTAQAIASSQGLEVVTDRDLREIDQGEWEGLTVDEIARRWPEMWGAARHYTTRPGGESPQEVRARSLAAIERIVAANPEGNVAVVSHGGTIRWIAAEALGYDDRRSARIRGLGNGQMVSIEASLENGKLVLTDLTRLDGNTPDLDDPND
jgi:broad specificity phosphatase PhoE